jgi:hypothetical protein
LFSDEELLAMGLDPYALGRDVDAAIIQCNHLEYKSLISTDLPGLKTLVDGRNLLDPDQFPKAKVVVIGNVYRIRD